MEKVICIAGPTASGKSAYALSIAEQVGGEIVNADSMQVYAPLHILSARPSEADMARVPHHLYGTVEGDVRYSTGEWLRDIMPMIKDIKARGNVPILVGGTGLYFQALTVGLADIPKPDAAVMAYVQGLLEQGVDVLRAEAERLDPVASKRVLGNDPQRLSRIVSVAKGTEKPLSEWQKNTTPLIDKKGWTGTLILPDRDYLYSRINNRYENMLQEGGLDEAQHVMGLGLDESLPMMKAIGLPPLMAYHKGKISYQEAVELAKRDTRRFAKRQFTWFRSRKTGWTCVQ